jgi:glycerol-3-phosphate dehydrogenase
LTVEIVRSAIQHGARLKTYTEVNRILTEGSVVRGVEATDLATGHVTSYFARAVVNVTGPWVDETLGLVPADRRPKRQMGGTKGTHLVVSSFADAPAEALYVEAKSDGRAFFIVPWNGAYLIGTTDTRFSGDLDEVHATRDDIDYLLRESNALFPNAHLTVDDLAYTYSGVRPLPYTEGGSAGAITRKHIIKDHAPQLKGLWSIIGGKLTTHRELAETATDTVCKALGIDAKCRTRRMPLPGAAGIATKAYAKALKRDAPLNGRTTERLTRIYGALAEEIITLAIGDSGLAEIIDPATGAIAAEVIYGFEREGAVTLEDLLMRRTMLGLEPEMAIGLDEKAATIAGRYLGWDTTKQQEQVAAYREHVATFKVR